MTEETEPQATPEEVLGTEEGPSEEVSQVAPTPEVAAISQEQLQELERKNKDLEHRLTQRGRELADQRRANEPTRTEEAIPADAYFQDPVGVTEKVVTKALAAFESRQEDRRNAEAYLASGAESRGSTSERLMDLHRRVQAAQDNPDEYLDILASLDQAQNTATEIKDATTAAVNTAQRNARAVTTEGGGTQVAPPAKTDDQMSVDELRAHIVKTQGEILPE